MLFRYLPKNWIFYLTQKIRSGEMEEKKREIKINNPNIDSNVLPMSRMAREINGGSTTPPKAACLQACNILLWFSLQGCEMQRQRDVSTYLCPFCRSVSFMSMSDLRRHVRIHTGEKPYACPFCQYRAKRTTHLQDHMRRKHP